MKKLIPLTLSTLLLSLTGCINPQKVGDPKKVVSAMANTIEKQFSETPQMTIEDFLKKKNDVILVDVRDEKEMKVSIIPGAITRKEFESQRSKYKDKKIVAYCTIGQRSTEYTKELKKEGFDAYNLKESILGWTHRKLPLVTPEGKETKKVHVYDEPWNLVEKSYTGVWND